jgi:hypothetical protein
MAPRRWRKGSVRANPPRRIAKILAGLLATGSVWNTKTFAANLIRALSSLSHPQRIDLGCALQQGSFERRRKLRISAPEESLIFFFIVRLLDRLAKNGPAKPTNLLTYLPSFK